MVLRNRLEYGFIGYQVPPVPRGTRSDRKKRLYRKEANDNQMCAFELLATVAGELSLEEENSRSSNVLSGDDICRNEIDSGWKEDQHADEASEAGNGGKGNCHTAVFAPVLKNSERAYKVASAEKLSHRNRETLLVCSGGIVYVPSSTYEEPCCTVEKESEQKLKLEQSKFATAVHGMKAEGPNLDDEVQVEEKNPPALDSVDKLPALLSIDYGDIFPSNTDSNFSDIFPACRDDVQLVIRDDDENSYGVNPPSTLSRPIRPQQVGNRTHRRIRKLLASKYLMPTQRLKDGGQFNADSRLRAIHYNSKKCFTRFRSQRVYPPRKRKLYDYGSLLNSNGMVGSKCISSPLRGGIGFDASASGGELCQEAQHTPTRSMSSLVKFKIKSFKVPELFIEIPETATVGSLKRTVMQAVTSVLGAELRVGVILQGKKIGDDNKTLLQTGISHDNRHNALGFSLEPNPVQPPPSFGDRDGPPLTSVGCQPLTRYASASGALYDSPLAYLGNLTGNNHNVIPSSADMQITYPSDPGALVVPQMNVVETLAVGPIRNSRSFQGAQRRIRRPFSVSEVESLVQAVEKLGTGRWRDIKLEAFDDAKHRTYVDLKDKWKTLVHTARLHPQQRRGEPVPQELLDRVLAAAHASWSSTKQQQQQQQSSHPQEDQLFP